MPALTRHTAFTQWEFVPLVTALLALLAALYLFGMLRVRRAHPRHPWPLSRAAAFFAGLLVVAVATQSSIAAYDELLFSMHMVQHLLLIMVAPALLVTGRPVMLLLHASRNPLHRWTKQVVRSRVVSALTFPPVAAVIYGIVIVGTHLTSFMNVVLRHESIHDFEHVLYLVAGYLYFLPLLGSEPIRWRMSYPGRFLLLALSMPVDTFVGVVLMQSSRELFPAYLHTGRTWGASPLNDLHAGGAIMWVGGDALMFVMMLFLFIAFLRDREAQRSMGPWLEGVRRQTLIDHTGQVGVAAPASTATARRSDTVDDDEHLAAYNAYLARLAEREQQ